MGIQRWGRRLGIALLVVATIHGMRQFVGGDTQEVLQYWRTNLWWLPGIILFVCLDVLFECIAWMWVYNRLGIRSWDFGGGAAFLSTRAGVLLPAQLGRLIGPDSMSRLGRGTIRECLKAEAVIFVLDTVSVLMIIAAWTAAKFIHPLAALPSVALVAAIPFAVGNSISKRFDGTAVEFPQNFWCSWQTLAILLVEVCGWVAHGLGFFLMLQNLPGDIVWQDTVFYTAVSAVIGSSSGLPGGIGATESLLGASFTMMKVPAAHLAIAIGAFRLLTFWLWIPLGWIALGIIKNKRDRSDPCTEGVFASFPTGKHLRKAA